MKLGLMLANGYEIIEEIGQGGMATVYLAIQKSLNRRVALKVLTHTSVPGFSERFLREARIVASLNHRHVVTIYDVGVDRERHYIAMEYLTGGDLGTRISQGIPVSMALRIVDNIAGALQAGHEKGIVHRDVKPANILFRNDGTPLLTDFGVAKQADTSTLVTKTGMILGTPAYLSPEQAHGIPLDGRADMYSLGIVLYEMLTGTRPYEGDSDISTIFKHAYDPLPRLPKGYHYLQPFLDKLLAKRREDRFEDMAAMRSVLRDVVRSGPSKRQTGGVVSSQAAPGSDDQDWLDNARDFFLSHKVGTALGVLIVSATVILLMYGPSDKNVEQHTALPQTEARSTAPEQPPVDVEQVAADSESEPSGVVGAATTEEVRAGSETKERLIPDIKPRVDRLIETGNERLAEHKAISPGGDSALYYFRLAETLDPGNPEAREGLYQVASHYAVLAERQIQERRYTQAGQFVDRGLRISPGHPRLRALERRLQLQRASRKVKRTSQEVLKSLGDMADDVVDKIKERTSHR